MRKLYPLSVLISAVFSGVVVTAAYGQPGSPTGSVWAKPADTNSANIAAKPSQNKQAVPNASKQGKADANKKLPDIVFGNNFTKEIHKIRSQAEGQGKGTSGNALVARKKASRNCLYEANCSRVNADDDAVGTSLDVSFDDDDDYIAPRADGGTSKDLSTSSVGLRRNFQNNWNVTGAATFKDKGRGGTASIGYKW